MLKPVSLAALSVHARAISAGDCGAAVRLVGAAGGPAGVLVTLTVPNMPTPGTPCSSQ